jgi:hypothetical protein
MLNSSFYHLAVCFTNIYILLSLLYFPEQYSTGGGALLRIIFLPWRHETQSRWPQKRRWAEPKRKGAMHERPSASGG